jgi:hypothetical protein
VRGDGLGGRNQEMVLAFGLALEPLVAEGAIIKGQLLRFAMESNASDYILRIRIRECNAVLDRGYFYEKLYREEFAKM